MIDLSENYLIFDNPEVLALKNPDGSEATTNYGFRRMATVAFIDQSGMQKVENVTRFMIWKANVTPWIPQIDCEITDTGGKKYYVNEYESQADRQYYSLHCTQQV